MPNKRINLIYSRLYILFEIARKLYQNYPITLFYLKIIITINHAFVRVNIINVYNDR